MSESHVRYFRIDSKDLVYLKFVLEAYEGLATLSTEDAAGGIIRISTPARICCDTNSLLEALHAEISFTEVPPPPPLIAAKGQTTATEHYHA